MSYQALREAAKMAEGQPYFPKPRRKPAVKRKAPPKAVRNACARPALRQVARKICHHCQESQPHRDLRYRDEARYIHLRTKEVATGLWPGDPCYASAVWQVYEKYGGKIKEFSYSSDNWPEFKG